MNNKEIVRYLYEVVVSKNLIEELSQYISEDCVLKVGEETIPLGVNGMKQHLQSCMLVLLFCRLILNLHLRE